MKALIDMANGLPGDASPIYQDYEQVFWDESLNCDCDEKTRRKLAGIIVQYMITQEQVEVVWALTKDVEMVEMAAHDLTRGKTFPDYELPILIEWVREVKSRVEHMRAIGSSIAEAMKATTFSAAQVATAMKALGQAGIRAAAAGWKVAAEFEKSLKNLGKVTITSSGTPRYGLQLNDGRLIMIDEWPCEIKDLLNDSPSKSKQNNRPARVRKKHVFKAPDNKGLRSVLPESNRRGHVYQRRC